MHSQRLDYYSLTALPLDLRCNGQSIGIATGFFRRTNNAFWLVSNWHVFSGRNNHSGQPRLNCGAIPDEVLIPIHSNRLGAYHSAFRVALLDDGGIPLWRQHPRGQDVDIAAIILPTLPLDTHVYDVMSSDETADMQLRPGASVFVLGFPKGMMLQHNLPIWKRASVASEPELPVGGEKIILIDTATRDGMSGAPVFAREYGVYLSESNAAAMGGGTFTKFLGVYSGRYGAEDEFGAQIGRVWKRELIEEVIFSGKSGNHILRKA